MALNSPLSRGFRDFATRRSASKTAELGLLIFKWRTCYLTNQTEADTIYYLSGRDLTWYLNYQAESLHNIYLSGRELAELLNSFCLQMVFRPKIVRYIYRFIHSFKPKQNMLLTFFEKQWCSSLSRKTNSGEHFCKDCHVHSHWYNPDVKSLKVYLIVTGDWFSIFGEELISVSGYTITRKNSFIFIHHSEPAD